MADAAAAAAAAASIAFQQLHYADDRAPALLAASAICIVFVVMPVALRFYAQNIIRQAFAADMWLIAFAAVLAIAVTACNIVAVHNGLGKHEIRVQSEDPNPPSHTLLVFKLGYVVTVLQCLALMTTKLSILCFYRRAFTLRHKAFKMALWIVAAYSLVLGIASTIEFILQCLPISLFWNRIYLIVGDTPPRPLEGYCMPQTIHVAIPLVADLISEVAILILPIIGLWQLQLPIRKKVGLFFAFSLGIFVTAISIIRLVYAFQLENGGDLTMDDADSFIWTTVQVSFGVTCACVPAMAPLYRLARSKTGSSSSKKGPRSIFLSSRKGITQGSRSKFRPLDGTRPERMVDEESMVSLGSSGKGDGKTQGRGNGYTFGADDVGAPCEEHDFTLQDIRVETDISVKVGRK